jgi:hypothetical protein
MGRRSGSQKNQIARQRWSRQIASINYPDGSHTYYFAVSVRHCMTGTCSMFDACAVDQRYSIYVAITYISWTNNNIQWATNGKTSSKTRFQVRLRLTLTVQHRTLITGVWTMNFITEPDIEAKSISLVCLASGIVRHVYLISNLSVYRSVKGTVCITITNQSRLWAMIGTNGSMLHELLAENGWGLSECDRLQRGGQEARSKNGTRTLPPFGLQSDTKRHTSRFVSVRVYVECNRIFKEEVQSVLTEGCTFIYTYSLRVLCKCGLCVHRWYGDLNLLFTKKR